MGERIAQGTSLLSWMVYARRLFRQMLKAVCPWAMVWHCGATGRGGNRGHCHIDRSEQWLRGAGVRTSLAGKDSAWTRIIAKAGEMAVEPVSLIIRHASLSLPIGDALWLVVGTLAGATIGVKMNTRLSESLLHRISGMLLIAIAVTTVYKTMALWIR